jgi:hypothetical protein
MPFELQTSTDYTGSKPTPALVADTEEQLGYRLPEAYVELLAERNGGIPTRTCFRTNFETSWASNHFEITAILGVGRRGIERSVHLISEWGYPDIGIVICETPSAGHDTVMLDYRSGADDPAVAYIDEDRVPRVVALSFSEFLERLESPDGFSQSV